MVKIEIKKDDALTAYEKTSKEGRELLESLLGKETFNNSIDKLKTVEDVLKHFGIFYEDVKYMFGGLPERYMYQYIAELTCKAFNDGWQPDFSNDDQEKYVLCFSFDEATRRMRYVAPKVETVVLNNNAKLMLKSHDVVDLIVKNKEFFDIFKKAHGF